MVSVSYPGVYVEEIPSGVHTITGVSTSIASFFGRATNGPMDRALRIQNYSEFLTHFGDPHPQSMLAESVRLFFANGGADCYVIRLAHGANKASVTLRSIRSQTGSIENVLVAEAKNKGIWGNEVRIEINYNTSNPDETFNMVVIHEKEGRIVDSETFPRLSMNPSSDRFAPTLVTQESTLIDLLLHEDMCGGDGCDALNVESPINVLSNSFTGFSDARRPISQSILQDLIGEGDDGNHSFQINVNDTRPVLVSLAGWTIPADTDEIANELGQRITDALRVLNPPQEVDCSINDVTDVGNLIRITAATPGGADNSSVRITRAPSNDIAAALMLGVDQGGIEPVRWSNFRPAPTASFFTLGSVDSSGSLSETAQYLQDVNTIAALNQAAFDLTINGTDNTIQLTPENFVTVTGGRWYQSREEDGSIHGNNDGVREKLRIIAAVVNNAAEVPYRAEVWGYHLAIIANEGSHNQQPASLAVSDSLGVTSFDDLHIRNVRQYTLGSSGDSDYSSATSADDDGSDGTAPQVSDYLGNANDQSGFHALDPVDLFNLMVIPDDKEFDNPNTLERLWGSAGNYCKQHRAFLLIDPPKSWARDSRPTVKQNTDLIADLKATLGDAKDHAAVFYPRLECMDSMGLIQKIGPACVIAGLMSRIDSTRGVWKAPAGIEASLNNVMGLDVELTDPENGVLNKRAVNCIRKFPNGFVNWGARTMEGDDDTGSEWKYIPIRRLALFIEESLYRGTKWVVFEPNDEPLWAKIRLNVGVFMTGLFRQGAFQGTSPNKAFFVKCDAETTTQADRNMGIVNIVVGFAPLKPAEFVIVKIQQIAGDLI